MSKSSSETKPQTISTLDQIDNRVGIDGAGNLVQSGGSSYESQDTTISPTIDGDDNFAPIFNFAAAGNVGGTGSVPAARETYLNAYPNAFYSDAWFLDWWSANKGPEMQPQAWPEDYALLQALAGEGNAQAAEILGIPAASAPTSTPPAPAGPRGGPGGMPVGGGSNAGSIIPGNFGGAAESGGVVTGGGVTAPISSGEDSTAILTGPGGNVFGGDVDGVTISAPVSGPAAIIGGDSSAPVISGNISAPTTFGDGSPIIDISLPTSAAPPDAGLYSSPLVPVAAGEDSTALAASGSSVAAGGDSDVDGSNFISGNAGPVSVSSSDPEVVRDALSKSLEFAEKSLGIVAESQKDPGERVTGDALETVKWVALGLAAIGAVALWRRKSS